MKRIKFVTSWVCGGASLLLFLGFSFPTGLSENVWTLMRGTGYLIEYADVYVPLSFVAISCVIIGSTFSFIIRWFKYANIVSLIMFLTVCGIFIALGAIVDFNACEIFNVILFGILVVALAIPLFKERLSTIN